jgi:hypothetical protein
MFVDSTRAGCVTADSAVISLEAVGVPVKKRLTAQSAEERWYLKEARVVLRAQAAMVSGGIGLGSNIMGRGLQTGGLVDCRLLL